MKRTIRGLAVAIAATIVLTVGALAAVDVDFETGEGFVGKGDVQTALGWNNPTLQRDADDLRFRINSVQETTWLCYHTENPNAADQERSTEVSIQGVLSHTERLRNQITGFGIDGFDGDPIIDTDGGAVNSCPNPNRAYLEGSTETGDPSGGLQVSGDGGTTWVDL
jgi:hypothetical protein